jgi:hypothetical protein
MASKKLKKAIMAGLAGYAGAKMLGQKKEMAEYLKTEGGDKAKVNYITKKSKPQKFSFSADKFKKAVNTYKEKGLNTGPGANATSKMGGTLADKVLSRQNTGMEMFGGAKAGKMVKARGGKMVNLKPTKLY